MNQGRRTATFIALAVAAVLLAACSEGAQFPAELLGNQTAAGVVFVDADGDGQPGRQDRPLAGVRIEPLTGALHATHGSPVFGPDPNADVTATDEDGAFALSHRQNPTLAGIKVNLRVPVEGTNTEAAGELSRIVELEVGSTQNAIPFAAVPSDCSKLNDAEECGQLLLPDLTPITTWAQVAPVARAQLQASSSAPPLQGLLPTETWFVETADDGRSLLRFSSVTANLGPGPLDVIADGASADAGGIARTWQRLWTDRWNFVDEPSGDFIFHDGHDHMHFDAFERYRLLDASGAVVAASEKVSFCLRDSVRISDAPAPTVGPLGSIASCGANQQSINVGFADHYDQFLPDQWIDVTGVPPGRYVVEIIVDPLGLIIEADESNNQAWFEVELTP